MHVVPSVCTKVRKSLKLWHCQTHKKPGTFLCVFRSSSVEKSSANDCWKTQEEAMICVVLQKIDPVWQWRSTRSTLHVKVSATFLAQFCNKRSFSAGSVCRIFGLELKTVGIEYGVDQRANVTYRGMKKQKLSLFSSKTQSKNKI